MDFVIGWCKHDKNILCKNWDGKGYAMQEVTADKVVVCPEKIEKCQYKVKPKKEQGL